MRPEEIPRARIMLVAGKGGVGKTTIAALLTHLLSHQRVLFISLGVRDEDLRLARALLPEGVPAMAVGGERALAEYLGLHLASRRLYRRIVESELYHRFVAVAPGLRELMALGKVCDEERRGIWDAIVVDGPPTGHALEYLAMPSSASETFGGLVTWETARMLRGLRDPARALVFPVATPEELPIHELEQLLVGVQHLGMNTGAIFVNRVRRSPVSPDQLVASGPLSPAAEDALTSARVEASWALLHRRNLDRLRASHRLPIVEIPELACRSFGRDQIARLAEGGC